MSNEKLDEAGVLAKFGVRADQMLDLLALTGDAVDNVPGVPKVGPKTAAKWLAQYGSLDGVDRARRRDRRRRRREPARGARLAAAGHASSSRSRPTARCRQAPPISRSRAADADAAARRCTSASSSRAGCATRVQAADAPDAARCHAKRAREPHCGDAPGARHARRIPRRAAGGRAPPCHALRDGAGRGRARALARGASTRAELVCVRHRDDQPRPDAGEASSACRSRSRPGQACYIPLAHRYPGAPDQLDRRRDARAPRALARGRVDARSWARTSSTTSTCSRTTASRFAASRTTRCSQSYVLEAHRPHDMDNLAWRHSNVKTITYDEVARQGREADRVRPGRASSARRRTRPRMPTSRCSCIARCIRGSRPTPKLDRIYATIEMPVREVLFRMERNGVLIDAALLAQQSRELGASVMALEQQAYQLAGPAVQPRVRPSSSARSCSTR